MTREIYDKFHYSTPTEYVGKHAPKLYLVSVQESVNGPLKSYWVEGLDKVHDITKNCIYFEIMNEHGEVTSNVEKREIQSPHDGDTVVAIYREEGGKAFPYSAKIATFCDGSFYFLSYDPHLGVLRKSHMSENPEFWAEWSYPDNKS